MRIFPSRNVGNTLLLGSLLMTPRQNLTQDKICILYENKESDIQSMGAGIVAYPVKLPRMMCHISTLAHV